MAFNSQSDTHPWSRGLLMPMVSGGSAFGPRPRQVLNDREALDLVKEHAHVFGSNDRKIAAYARWLVMCEQHQGLIYDRVKALQKTEAVQEAIRNHIDTAVNPARDILNDVCAVWKHDAKRDVKGAGKKGRKAFLQLVDESRFATLARAWNRQAFFLGPVIAIPVVRRERLTFDTLLPHFTEVVFDPDDPWGAPVAALWDVQNHGSPIRQGQAPAADAVLLDDDGWRYFALHKSASSGNQEVNEWGQVGAAVPHGLDRFPGAVLRFDEFGTGSWWGNDPHQRLQDITISSGFIAAVLSYIRKSQCKKLLKAIGDIKGIPKGTTLDAEVPLEAATESPNQVQIDTIDFDTDPESFIKHITWLLQVVARSYGGHLATAPGSSSLLEAEIQFSYASLTELRNEQIPHARDFERDLWTKAVEMAKANGHPLADDLPAPEKVHDGFEIEFPRLARSFTNIDEEIKFWDFRLKNGAASYGDILREEMPLATDEERDAAVMERIDRQVPIVEKFTKRDLSQDPMTRDDASLKTPAQIQGAKGPAVRDGEEPQETETKEAE